MMNIQKDIIYLVLILFQAGIIIYFMMRKKKSQTTAGPGDDVPADNYEDQRKLISITPQQLNLQIPDSETFVYGVIMDWNNGENTTTLAVYINGAANIYFSSGEKVLGGGKNPAVGEDAAKLVANAQEYINNAMPVSIAELPSNNCVCFYLLTNKGLYAAREQMKHFENNSSSWMPLFIQGGKVITEMMN